MMKKRRLLLLVLITVVLAIVACTPKATTSPTQSPLAQKSVSSVMTPAAPTVSPEESAWDKVVKAAKTEGKVTLYATSQIGDDMRILADAFFEKYGIRVESIGGVGNTHVERLKTEKRMGQMAGDTAQLAVSFLLIAKEAGLLSRQVDLPILQNKARWEVDPYIIDPEGYVPISEGNWVAPVINTRLVGKGNEPRSLRDLLKPDWKGKIASVTPLTGTVMISYYVAFINRNLIDWSYVEAIGKQVGGYGSSSPDTLRLVARGEFPLTQAMGTTFGGPYLAEGAPIKALSMEEGDIFNPMGFGLIDSAPHPNATKLFLNWMYGEEAARLKAEKTKMGVVSLLKGVPSGVPEVLTPPSKKIIVLSKKDMDDATRLYTDGQVAKLWNIKK